MTTTANLDIIVSEPGNHTAMPRFHHRACIHQPGPRVAEAKPQEHSQPVPGPTETAVVHLPLRCLVEDPGNDRKTFRNMKGLLATIRLLGVIDPVDVVPLAGCQATPHGHQAI